jgi:hypothetical protein
MKYRFILRHWKLLALNIEEECCVLWQRGCFRLCSNHFRHRNHTDWFATNERWIGALRGCLCNCHPGTGHAVACSIPNVIGFFIWPNLSNRTMVLGLTQPLTEMSTRNLPSGKRRPALRADNLTAICEPIVSKMWEHRRLTTLCAPMIC